MSGTRPTFLAGIPTGDFIDADSGDITPSWRAFLLSLWRRTGGAVGQSSDTTQIEADLAAETTARISGDASLGSDIVAERGARQSADGALNTGLSNEAATRNAVDGSLTARLDTNAGTIAAETSARIAADALLVPLAQLCTLWASCNLGFLPTSDPGGNKPWLNAGVVTVGAPVGTVFYLGLEDASGHWELQDGTGGWVYG
ncbi:MAG TPA: hypothetical protein VGH84_06670 [Steroidobacteraceae bacterium]